MGWSEGGYLLQQTHCCRNRGGGAAAVGTEEGEDLADVALDRSWADVQFLGNLAGGLTIGH